MQTLIDFVRNVWPRTIYDWQTVAATGALLSSSLFVILYSLVTWWKTNTGRNLMAMGVCLAFLASGSVVRRLVHLESGHTMLLVGWSFIAIVMAWRTVQMWRSTHPKNAPPPAPVNPTSSDPETVDRTGRQWYTPTPSSVLEKPYRKGK